MMRYFVVRGSKSKMIRYFVISIIVTFLFASCGGNASIHNGDEEAFEYSDDFIYEEGEIDADIEIDEAFSDEEIDESELDDSMKEEEPIEGNEYSWLELSFCPDVSIRNPLVNTGWQFVHPWLPRPFGRIGQEKIASHSSTARDENNKKFISIDYNVFSEISDKQWQTLPAHSLPTNPANILINYNGKVCGTFNKTYEFGCSIACIDEHGCWKCELDNFSELYTWYERQRHVYTTSAGELLSADERGVRALKNGAWYREEAISNAIRGAGVEYIFETKGDIYGWGSIGMIEVSNYATTQCLFKRTGRDWIQLFPFIDNLGPTFGNPVKFHDYIYLPSTEASSDIRGVTRCSLNDLQCGFFKPMKPVTVPTLSWYGGTIVENKLYIGGGDGYLMIIDEDNQSATYDSTPIINNKYSTGEIKQISYENNELILWGSEGITKKDPENDSWISLHDDMFDKLGLSGEIIQIVGESSDHYYILYCDQSKCTVIEREGCRVRDIAAEFNLLRSLDFPRKNQLYYANNILYLNNNNSSYKWLENGWSELRNRSQGVFYYRGSTYSFFNGKFECLDEKCPNIPKDLSIEINYIYPSENTLWASDYKKNVFKWNGTDWVHYQLSEYLSGQEIQSISANDTDAWVGRSLEGIYHLKNDGSIENITSNSKLNTMTDFSSLSYVNGYVYTNNFWRYDLNANTWMKMFDIYLGQAQIYHLGNYLMAASGKNRILVLNVNFNNEFCNPFPPRKYQPSIECEISSESIPISDCNDQECLITATDACIGTQSFNTRNIGTQNFIMDKYEVSNARYRACVQAGTCTIPHFTESRVPQSYFTNNEFDNYPVRLVDWNQAYTFCKFEGKRLPTELEWLLAAQGLDGRRFPWGNEEKFNGRPFNDFVNAQGGKNDVVQVDALPLGASPYGIEQMSGNVAEWTTSIYVPFSPSCKGHCSVIDDDSVNDYRVIKGGDYRSIYYQIPVPLLPYSYRNPQDYYSETLGFRCVKDIN